MFRRLWQSNMIALARSGKVKRFMQTSRATSFLRDKYVAGETPDSGIERAEYLFSHYQIRSSLFYMGEYVDEPALVAENIENKLRVIQALCPTGMDLHVSVDPTQIGHQVAPESVEANARQIARALLAGSNCHSDLLKADHVAERVNDAQPEARPMNSAPSLNCLLFDMEDASLNAPTIALHNQLQDEGLPVALTLQAYLHRTFDDMQAQIQRGSTVRLVKGAFAAGPELALQSTRDIKANSRKLIELMLSPQARESSFYPVIATHDTRLHDFAISTARTNGWQPGEYEFEMLLGVREDVAKALAQRGERVRLYVPFGKDWWPHAVRRIGENPKNAVLLARSLVS